MRRRAVWVLLLATVTAFLYAVQRDTVVRRWLVPRPTAPTEAKLNSPYEGDRLAVASIDQRVADISLRAGVPIALADRAGLEQAGIDTAYAVDWRIRSSTAGAALTEVCMYHSTPTAMLGFEVRGDAVLVGTDDALAAGHVVRVHDLTELIRAERARHAAWAVSVARVRPADSRSDDESEASAHGGAPTSLPAQPDCSPGQRRSAPFSDAAVEEALHRSVEHTLHSYRRGPTRAGGGVFRAVGGRLIVAHTPVNQRRVAFLIDRITRDGFPPPSWCGN